MRLSLVFHPSETVEKEQRLRAGSLTLMAALCMAQSGFQQRRNTGTWEHMEKCK